MLDSEMPAPPAAYPWPPVPPPPPPRPRAAQPPATALRPQVVEVYLRGLDDWRPQVKPRDSGWERLAHLGGVVVALAMILGVLFLAVVGIAHLLSIQL